MLKLLMITLLSVGNVAYAEAQNCGNSDDVKDTYRISKFLAQDPINEKMENLSATIIPYLRSTIKCQTAKFTYKYVDGPFMYNTVQLSVSASCAGVDYLKLKAVDLSLDAGKSKLTVVVGTVTGEIISETIFY